jgi:hypothetical protein
MRKQDVAPTLGSLPRENILIAYNDGHLYCKIDNLGVASLKMLHFLTLDI